MASGPASNVYGVLPAVPAGERGGLLGDCRAKKEVVQRPQLSWSKQWEGLLETTLRGKRK